MLLYISNTHNIVKYSIIIENRILFKRKKWKQMPTLFPSDLGDLGCYHILTAWAGLGPKAGLSRGWGSWGVGAADEPSLDL